MTANQPPPLFSSDDPIVVIGAGLAGTTCAHELAQRGHPVVLAHRRAASKPALAEICGPVGRRLLEAAFGEPLPDGSHAGLAHFQSAWGTAHVDARCFKFWQTTDALVVDRRALEEWLLACCERAEIEVLYDCDIRNVKRHRAGWALENCVGGQPRSLFASFIVEATGRAARAIAVSDATRLATDALVCVSFEVAACRETDAIALVESCPDGWWYTARQPHGSRIVALFTDADLIASTSSRYERLRQALAATIHVRKLAGSLTHNTLVRACDARTSIRRLLWRQTWLAIGDAAWALDPLSGAGIRRAVASGLAAATAISDARAQGDLEPVREHALSQAHAFLASLETQRWYYGLETRWPDATFWRRRQNLASDGRRVENIPDLLQ